MAAHLKFTPELGAEICKLVRVGIPIGVAARAQGVAKSTLYEWKDRGEKDGAEEQFAVFARDLEKALADCEVKITAHVIKAAAKDWKAGAFWLKCRHPEIYGDELKITQQVQRGAEEMFDSMRPHMSDPAYLEMLHAFAKVMGVEGLADRPAERSAEGESSH